MTGVASPLRLPHRHSGAHVTTINVNSSSQLNTSALSLLLIGDSENALVTGVNSTAVTIDTDRCGREPVARARVSRGDPIYRLDVLTFQVATRTSQLQRDNHHGGGAQ